MKVTFKRAGVEFEFDASGLNENMRERLLVHGITQKIGDAAANAAKAAEEAKMPVEEWARAQMNKVADALLRGDWGRERGEGGGTTLSREEVWRDRLVREAIKASAHKTAFKIASDERKEEMIVLAYMANKDHFDQAVADAIKAEDAKKKKLSSIKIDF